jgi:hypothetical protein
MAITKKTKNPCWKGAEESELLWAHACNPSYSGNRRSWFEASLEINSLRNPISKKKTFTKKGLVE